MSQKNQLNLASLHQRQEEITEKEMKVVVAGVTYCECWPFDSKSGTSLAENVPACACGSIWVIIGLTF